MNVYGAVVEDSERGKMN